MEYLTMSDTDLEEIWGVEARVHYTNDRDVRYIVNDFFYDAFDQDMSVLGDHTVAVTGFPPEKFVIQRRYRRRQRHPRPRTFDPVQDKAIILQTIKATNSIS